MSNLKKIEGSFHSRVQAYDTGKLLWVSLALIVSGAVLMVFAYIRPFISPGWGGLGIGFIFIGAISSSYLTHIEMRKNKIRSQTGIDKKSSSSTPTPSALALSSLPRSPTSSPPISPPIGSHGSTSSIVFSSHTSSSSPPPSQPLTLLSSSSAGSSSSSSSLSTTPLTSLSMRLPVSTGDAAISSVVSSSHTSSSSPPPSQPLTLSSSSSGSSSSVSSLSTTLSNKPIGSSLLDSLSSHISALPAPPLSPETPMQKASLSLIGQSVDITVSIHDKALDMQSGYGNILGVRFIIASQSLPTLISLRKTDAINRIPQKSAYTLPEQHFILTLLSAAELAPFEAQVSHALWQNSRAKIKALEILQFLTPNEDEEFIIRLSRLVGDKPLDLLTYLYRKDALLSAKDVLLRHSKVFCKEWELLTKPSDSMDDEERPKAPKAPADWFKPEWERHKQTVSDKIPLVVAPATSSTSSCTTPSRTSDEISLPVSESDKSAQWNCDLFPRDLNILLLSYLDAVYLEACRSIQKWETLADESIDMIFKTKSDFQKYFPSLHIFDESDWRSYADLSSLGLDVDDVSCIEKRTLFLRLCEFFRRQPPIEGNSGVLLFTIPKGLTINKVKLFAKNPLKGNVTDFSFIGALGLYDTLRVQEGVGRLGDCVVDQTYTFLITRNVIDKSRVLSFEQQKNLVGQYGGIIPTTLEALSAIVVSHIVSKDHIYTNYAFPTARGFTHCAEQINFYKRSGAFYYSEQSTVGEIEKMEQRDPSLGIFLGTPSRCHFPGVGYVFKI